MFFSRFFSFVIARSEATKPSRLLPRRDFLDRFRLRSLSYGGQLAALAMTVIV